MSGDPFPKSSQLARGERRYRRKVASPKQWAAIRAAKLTSCRVCDSRGPVAVRGLLELHHVIPRDRGGDDLADNLVCVCHHCHALITSGDRVAGALLVSALDDAEYAYAVEKGGEQVFERVYGITYTR